MNWQRNKMFWGGCILFIFIISLESLPIGLSKAILWIGAGYAGFKFAQQFHGWHKNLSIKSAQRERSLKLLASIMGLCFASGALMFWYAFEFMSRGQTGHQFINAELLMRSLICSLDLFMLDIDSNILDALKEHPRLKGAISIQAALSFTCTITLLVSLVYARMQAYFKLRRLMKCSKKKHLYIFFGMDEESEIMAESIYNCDKEEAIILFVENTAINENDKDGWDSLVSFFANKRRTFEDVDKYEAYVTFTDTQPREITNVETDNRDLFQELDIPKVRSLITGVAQNKEETRIHLFFLSDREEENVRDIEVLAQDKTICQLAGENAAKITIYCHARRNGINKSIEDIAVKKGLEIQIVDSSNLSIELLKKDPENHPVHFVELDETNKTTVRSEFSSLIVGFDETGQDALGFLYEFSAFVHHNSTSNNAKRSPFKCVAVDNRMDIVKGKYKTFRPGMFNQPKDEVSIELYNYDFNSEEFYTEVLSKVAEKLNYVIIAVGNDELGITLAVNIFNYVRQHREDLSKLRIMVRSYSKQKITYMEKIIDHYNNGDKNRDFPIIRLFGKAEEIYSYKMIVAEDFIKQAKHFQESYMKMSGEPDSDWETRRDLAFGKKEKKANRVIPIEIPKRKTYLENLRKLRRQEWQDLCNTLHMGTKMFLLKRAFSEDYDWNAFLQRYAHTIGKVCEPWNFEEKYSELLREERDVIQKLAILEHLRWNASHEVLGYIGTKPEDNLHKCNERTRRHNCLRPWQELDEESKLASSANWKCDYKKFDFAVVDTTISLCKGELM